MSYALSGSTPNPIPSTNTSTAQGFEVGSYAFGLLNGHTPWLDANLTIRNVTLAQWARELIPLIRSTLVSSGATVGAIRSVQGGFIYVKWKPNSARPAVEYATYIRDLLLQAASALGSRSQILMTRFRVEMPTGRENIYVYPNGAPPPPPPPVPGSVAAPTTPAPPEGSDPGESSGSGTTIALAIGGISVLATLAVAGYYFSKRKTVRRNRRLVRR